jgi:transcriptional regulator with XRE-family HTH domain
MSEQRSEVALLEWDLADRMRKALRTGGVKVNVMADYLGVSRNTVGNYINGHTPPDRRTLRLWAMRCGVPFEWLETGTTSEAPHPDGDGGPVLPRLDSNQEPSGYLFPQVIALRAA